MATLPQLQSTTLEGAFLEMAFLLQSGEVNRANKGVVNSDFLNIIADTNEETITVAATIPIFFGACGAGGSIAAAEYMSSQYVHFTTNS